jgi:hypothetical protein
MLTVTIDRNKWDVYPNGVRADSRFDEGRLFNPETGLMCCLGFVGLTCGFTPEEMKGLSEPYEVLPRKVYDTNGRFIMELNEKWPTGSFKDSISDLISINDDRHISNKFRELALIQRGLEAGIQFVFVGEYLK